MFLKSIEYVQYKGQPQVWQLEGCKLGDINLIVGKNASGKTKTLNIIDSLANLLSRNRKLTYRSGNFKAIFDYDGKEVIYILQYEDNNVHKEKLTIDSKVYLNRGKDGEGTIHAVQIKKERMKFKTPTDEIAAFSKRDSIQHPFLDALYHWAENLSHFYFGTSLGKELYASIIKGKGVEKQEIDLKDTNLVVHKFRIGSEKFGKEFVTVIKRDMASIDYDIKSIEIGSPISVTIKPTPELPSPPEGLLVKEGDLKDMTDQNSMAQGMFRSLSLIIQITYSQFDESVPSCILIDDIGEGLDYERSSKLIKLLVKKVEQTSTQLIMTTNDRFIMNNVPLKYWSVIQRVGNKSVIFNYFNSKKIFDDFELTGLSNFDFFSSKYFSSKSAKK